MVFVDHADGPDRVRQLARGNGDGVKGGVDRPRLDGGGRGMDVGVEGHDVQLDLRMRTVEVLQQHRRCGPSTVDVDAEGAPSGAYGCVGPRLHPEQFPGMGQERLAVDRELGAASRAGEQPYLQILLQRGDALGHGLLGDRQHGGRVLELAGIRGGDEGTDGIEIHGPHPSVTTVGCGSPPMQLFDPLISPLL